ncbi:ArsR/SmtB family transcription factor [Chelativorans salis]|uniref:Metalloregulator ArsR/SmtB family transcription factor n=1 Tax=Chelativorans salis TaxID=2978478 RepID=A0ABT2LN18_9HYPH|nr:metalloregulator ArsR/SmtB family transcription factor [Chelativorans sp. EGI FJ00035]MCT7375960.1 metalloregulator ArsR/SmtB family transcription factor [Chelativorans sp. EGI FJ00035]
MNSLANISEPSAPASGCCAPDVLSRGLFALAHPARIEILRYLSGVDYCCCKDVVCRLQLAQSTVSQHLKILLEAGLVRMSPQGQRSRYAVDREALLALSGAVGGLLNACAARADENGREI